MKHVQACLCGRVDRECSFHCCGDPVWLVQACLCAENLDNNVLTSEWVL